MGGHYSTHERHFWCPFQLLKFETEMDIMLEAKVYFPSRGQLVDVAMPPGKILEPGGILEEPGRPSIFLDSVFVEVEVPFQSGLGKP